MTYAAAREREERNAETWKAGSVTIAAQIERGEGRQGSSEGVVVTRHLPFLANNGVAAWAGGPWGWWFQGNGPEIARPSSRNVVACRCLVGWVVS